MRIKCVNLEVTVDLRAHRNKEKRKILEPINLLKIEL
jgi:hypothetical protein